MGFLAAGIIAGAAAIGVGAAGAAGAFDPAKPDYRSLPKEVQDYLNTQAPILASHKTYDPQYAAMYDRLRNQSLFGGGESPGLLEEYQKALPGINDTLNQVSNTNLKNQLAQYSQFAPEAKAAFARTNPHLASLLENMLGSASTELGYGTQLSPTQTRNIAQSVRAAQQVRGGGYGQGDAANEAVASVVGGQNLYQQRLGNAASASQLYASLYPQMSLPGSSTGNIGGGPSIIAQLLGQGGASPQYAAGQFGTPFNGYSSNLYDTNLGAQMNYNNTVANIRAASAKTIASAASSAYGGGGSGMGGGMGGGFGQGGGGGGYGGYNPYGY